MAHATVTSHRKLTIGEDLELTSGDYLPGYYGWLKLTLGKQGVEVTHNGLSHYCNGHDTFLLVPNDSEVYEVIPESAGFFITRMPGMILQGVHTRAKQPELGQKFIIKSGEKIPGTPWVLEQISADALIIGETLHTYEDEERYEFQLVIGQELAYRAEVEKGGTELHLTRVPLVAFHSGSNQ
jgi:hypothetical protein